MASLKNKNYLANCPMGYIILFKGGRDFISRGIIKEQLKRGFTKEQAQYTHCAVSGGNYLIVEVSFPKIRVIDIRKKFKGRYACIVKFRKKGYRKKEKVAFFAASNCNLGYDFWGILWFKCRWLFKHQKRFYFCSENVLWSLKKVYPRAMSIPPHQCLPAHFLSSIQFKKTWEGKIPIK